MKRFRTKNIAEENVNKKQPLNYQKKSNAANSFKEKRGKAAVTEISSILKKNMKRFRTKNLNEQDNIQSAAAAANINSQLILKDSTGKQISVENVQVKDNELIMDPVPPIDKYYDGDSFTLEYANETHNGTIINGDAVFEFETPSDQLISYNNKTFYSIRVSGLGPMT